MIRSAAKLICLSKTIIFWDLTSVNYVTTNKYNFLILNGIWSISQALIVIKRLCKAPHGGLANLHIGKSPTKRVYSPLWVFFAWASQAPKNDKSQSFKSFSDSPSRIFLCKKVIGQFWVTCAGPLCVGWWRWPARAWKGWRNSQINREVFWSFGGEIMWSGRLNYDYVGVSNSWCMRLFFFFNGKRLSKNEPKHRSGAGKCFDYRGLGRF